jgi:membrane protease YdiL (CAAX protease family)
MVAMDDGRIADVPPAAFGSPEGSPTPDEIVGRQPLTFAWFLGGFIGLELLYFDVWIAPVVFAAYVLLVHRAEHRSCREVRGGLIAVGEGLLGLGVGILLYLLPLLAALTLGHARATSSLSLADLRYAVVPGTLYAFAEEPIYRGLLLRYSELKVGSWWALLVSSVVFAALHFRGPSSWGELILGGAVFGAAYLLTRRLWLSIGLHAGWDSMVTLVNAQHLTHMSWQVEWPIQLLLLGCLLFLANRRGLLVSRRQARATLDLDSAFFAQATRTAIW